MLVVCHTCQVKSGKVKVTVPWRVDDGSWEIAKKGKSVQSKECSIDWYLTPPWCWCKTYHVFLWFGVRFEWTLIAASWGTQDIHEFQVFIFWKWELQQAYLLASFTSMRHFFCFSGGDIFSKFRSLMLFHRKNPWKSSHFSHFCWEICTFKCGGGWNFATSWSKAQRPNPKD